MPRRKVMTCLNQQMTSSMTIANRVAKVVGQKMARMEEMVESRGIIM